MSRLSKFSVALIAATVLIGTSSVQSAEGRYQAEWNGKYYLIMDTDRGHMWTFQGDSMIYNGRIDGDEFEPPIEAQIWQQSHGKWTRRK